MYAIRPLLSRNVIHSGARPVKLLEVEDTIARIEDRISSLRSGIAMPLLTRLRDTHTRSHKMPGRLRTFRRIGHCDLGQAEIGRRAV
jgi:hypothetical protein